MKIVALVVLAILPLFEASDVAEKRGAADLDFLVRKQGDVSGVHNPLVFDIVESNPGGHYSTTTGVYTIPSGGGSFYFSTFIDFSGNGWIYASFYVDGALAVRKEGYGTISLSFQQSFNAGQTVQVGIEVDPILYIDAEFSGYRV